MKKLFTISLICISFIGFSQKIRLKKEEVIIDDVVWLKYEKSNGFDLSLTNLSGEEVVFLKFVKQGSNNMIFSSDGEPNYFEISFLGLNKKIEIRNFDKEIITIIYKANAINEDGTLNEDKVERLVEKYGTPFSDKSSKSSNNTNTIIIKQEPSKSGVNINIGG